MKRILTMVLGSALALLVPLTSLAATYTRDERVSIEQGFALGDHYIVGERVDIRADVPGDLVVAAGNVDIDAAVENSLFIAGGTITIDGRVGHALRVAGGDVTLSGQVDGDVLVMAGTLTITSDAVIGGDLWLLGGQVSIKGEVGGNVRLQAGEVSIGAHVVGNVDGQVGALDLLSGTIIDGHLIYRASAPATMASDVIIRGANQHQNLNVPSPDSRIKRGVVASIFSLGFLYTYIVTVLYGLLVIFLRKKRTPRVIASMRAHPWKMFAIGIIVIIVAPVLIAFLFVSVWIGIAAALFYALLLSLAWIMSQIFLGALLLSFIRKKGGQPQLIADWKAVMLGVLVTMLMIFIPIFGWVAFTLLFAMGVGTLLLDIRRAEAGEDGAAVEPEV